MRRRGFILSLAAATASPGTLLADPLPGQRILTARGRRADPAWVLDRVEAFCDEMSLLDLNRRSNTLAGRLKRQKRWCDLPGLAEGSILFMVRSVSGGSEVRVVLEGVRVGPRDDDALTPLDQTQQMKVLSRLTTDLRSRFRRSCGSACTA